MNTPEKILMLIGQFHPTIGGAEQECKNLSGKLLSLGHAVTVLTEYRDGLPPIELVENIPVYRKIRGWHLFELTYMLSVFLLLWRLRRNFSSIICFGLYLYTAPAVLFALCSRKKIFFRLECSGETGDFCRVTQLKTGRFILRCAKRAQRIFAISSEIERELLHNGFSHHKIIRMPNSVDTKRFIPASCSTASAMPTRIGFIGRLDRQKGIDVLLAALQNLSARGIPFKAVIAGDGPIRQELVELSARLSLSDAIIFAGPQRDTVPFYRQTDILVLPSRAEGLPLVLLEGMATALGIVATSVGGIPEVLSPDPVQQAAVSDYSICAHGLMVAPENSLALASALQRLIEDTALRRQLGIAARKHIEEHYALTMVAQRYLSLMAAP